MAANRTILLRCSESGLFDEKRTGAAGIKPGMNVILQADNTVVVGVAALKGFRIVRENALQGGTVDDAYASGDVCFLYLPVSGDRLNLLLKTGQNIARGAGVKFDASGQLIADAGAGTEFIAEESVNATAAAALIAVRKV